jgi:rod shape-determining protein MreC
MESFIGRYRNVSILAALLFGQVLALAIQVQRPTENRSSRLIRIWAVSAVTPLEKGIVGLQSGAGNLWHNYFYLRGVRQENRDLKKKIQDLEIERVRLTEDAEQAHRLQALLGFKEQYIAKTVGAQVIGSSGSEQSRSIYIDKGSSEGIKPDMPVITEDGVVGKVLRSFKTTSQVLLINDQTSGVGALLEKSRLQGVLRGTPAGEVVLEKVMADEEVQPGEKVITSGGDQIFPKGLPVGTVTKVSPGPELFLNIRVKPAADMTRLEEVLVITQKEERQPAVADGERMRAADILAQRLPSVPNKPDVTPPANAAAATNGSTKPEASTTPQSASGQPKAPVSPKPVAGVNSPAGATTASQKPAAAVVKPTAKLLNTSNSPQTSTAKQPPVTEPASTDSAPSTNQAPAPPAPQTTQPATNQPSQDQPQ